MFDGSQKEIGRGSQAIVYYKDGFAYKVYNHDYPPEWIDYEILLQNEINKTCLRAVKYYKTDDPYITRMDFIDGITLGDRMRNEKYKRGIEDLIALQKQVNAIKDINLHSLKSFFENDIKNLLVEEDVKGRALNYLNEIEDKNNVCHLDFHLLNIMYSKEQYYIIDWINARLGNPIYDYARTYVILYEFAYRLSQKYLSLILKDKMMDTRDINKAIYVMTLLRIKESGNIKLQELLNK